MKLISSVFLVFGLFVGMSATVFSQNDVPPEIVNSLKSGDSKTLAKFFSDNVDMVILDKEDVFSKTQAEIIVKDFFDKNKPTGFKVVHKGGKDGSKYVVGELTTSTGTYRIYILLKTSGAKNLIQQFRIEND